MNNDLKDAQRVHVFHYDGTIESYNKMVDRLYSDPKLFLIENTDDSFDRTNYFTGYVRVFNMTNHQTIMFKPNDSYIVHEPIIQPTKE